jgi:hypothetical protein
MHRMLYSKVIIEPKGGGEPVNTFTSPLPPDVELDTVRSYYCQRFGEPTEVAFTETSGLGRVAIGWVFDLPEDFDVSGPPENLEMLLVPMVADNADPNVLQSAFLCMEEEKAEFRRLHEGGKFDSYVEHTAPQREYERES